MRFGPCNYSAKEHVIVVKATPQAKPFQGLPIPVDEELIPILDDPDRARTSQINVPIAERAVIIQMILYAVTQFLQSAEKATTLFENTIVYHRSACLEYLRPQNEALLIGEMMDGQLPNEVIPPVAKHWKLAPLVALCRSENVGSTQQHCT